MTRKKLLPIVLALLTLGHAAAAQSPLTLFGNGTPKIPVDPDTNSVTLGVKFWSSQAGTIKGTPFYRAAQSASGYLARLYKADGTMLASNQCHLSRARHCRAGKNLISLLLYQSRQIQPMSQRILSQADTTQGISTAWPRESQAGRS